MSTTACDLPIVDDMDLLASLNTYWSYQNNLAHDNMLPLSPIEDLALQIASSAKTIAEYLKSQNQSQPSFDRDAPTDTFACDCPKEILKSRQSLIEASLKIFQLATGPSEFLPNLAVGYQTLSALRWLIYFKIFTHVPLTGFISYDGVTHAASVPSSTLKRVLRMAMTAHLFCEPSPNHVSHTSRSALFVTNPNYAHWAEFMVESGMPTATHLVEATRLWGDDAETNHTAYNIAMETDLPFFDHLKKDKLREEQFAGYMRAVTDGEGTKLEHLVNGFDWAGLGHGMVVDVGGSAGHASFALATAYPKLSFIVQDMPTVLNEILRPSHTSRNSSLGDRLLFQPYDFFHPQPIQKADVYLLRMILHDWPYASAVKILQNIVPSLAENSRILIMDTVLPAPGEVTPYKEALLRVRDLTMLQVFNAGERGMEDWEEVIKGADSRFKIVSVKQPFGSTMGIIEVALDGWDS